MSARYSLFFSVHVQKHALTCHPLQMERSLIAMEQTTVDQLVLWPATAVTLATFSMGLTLMQVYAKFLETGVIQQSPCVMVSKMYRVKVCECIVNFYSCSCRFSYYAQLFTIKLQECLFCWILVALVYLSLSSTTIINNTEILITDIGEEAENSLSCHTDLVDCCRNQDTTGPEPLGEWYYPDGSVVQNNGGSEAANESFHRGRNLQRVNLLRREELNPLSPTGSYCCEIPTTEGNTAFCATVGM